MKNKDNQILYPNRYRQPIAFRGLDIGKNMYPTDIDGLIEYKDLAYLFFDVKTKGTPFKKGQKLALERLVKDTNHAGKISMAFLVEHEVYDPNETVYVEEGLLKRVCVFDKEEEKAIWKEPRTNNITVKEAYESFFELVEDAEKKRAKGMSNIV